MKRYIITALVVLVSFITNAQTVERIYLMENQSVTSIEGYTQICFKDCMQSALAGQPSLPWHTVALLLPQGTHAESIDVEMSDFKELEGEYQLFPYQPSRTYNDDGRMIFYKDEAVYSSKGLYPAENHGILTTQYVNGYSIGIASFTPVQYIPSEGKVMIANKVTVRIHAAAGDRDDKSAMLSTRRETINRIKSLVQNPEMVDTYKGLTSKSLEGYELLVITPEQYVGEFDGYVQFYRYLDIRTNVVSTESIYQSMQGIDNQDKIRNFIIQEYQDNDIMMVLLGGDVALVPYRGFYCDVLSGGSHTTDNGIPADLYYSGLDGTWNDNGNDRWGEPGEDDLYPEIGIARMPFNNVTQLSNMLNKTVKYQQIPVLGEFRTVVLGGEKLHDAPYTQGSQYLELLIGTHDDNGYTTVGIDEDYNFVKLYDEDGNWSGSKLRNAINNGTGYVHHSGHANSEYVAGWNSSGVGSSTFAGANGTDHNYTFFHSHGCDCGSFDQNCIMERLVTIETFAVSVIGNSRYGWFNEGQTEGPSCHLEREMTDAFWDGRIPYLGMAFSQGKCQTAPWVTAPGQWEEGALRWNFYDLNILGDVAVSPWHDEPFDASVRFRPAMLPGETVNEIYVSHDGQPLRNFRCGIYYYDEKLGEAVTDETGNAVVTLSRPVDMVDQLSLTVTGMNSFPQSRVIECIDDQTTFVKPYNMIAVDANGNGIIEPGESVSFNLVVKNWGAVQSPAINASVGCCSPDYFKFLNTEATCEGIAGMSFDTIYDAFAIRMTNDVPDGWVVTLNITVTDGTGYWYNSFSYDVAAPNLQVTEVSCVEVNGNDNGNIDPGEDGLLRVKVRNLGGVFAENGEFSVDVNNELIVVDNPLAALPLIPSQEEVVLEFTFHVDENVPNSTLVEFFMTTSCGEYLSEKVYMITVGYLMDGFETGDFSKLDWVQGGDSGWFVTDSEAYEGSYSARSGMIENNQISSLMINVNMEEPGDLSFFFKTSTELHHDYLVFYVDGNMKERWSGELDWQEVSYSIGAGRHVIEWRYDKSIAGASGNDVVFIDNVTFPDNTIVVMGVPENMDNQGEISIYPNPCSGVITVKSSDAINEMVVYNSLGQVVYRNTSLSNNETIDVYGMPAGIYFVKINNGITRKIVIK